MIKAPKKLSKAIFMALNDLALVEADDKYAVNMNAWHNSQDFRYEYKCAVCFAGSVMAKTLNSDYKRNVSSYDFDDDWLYVFRSLDEIRRGNIYEALTRFSVRNRADEYYFLCGDFISNIGSYEENPELFKEAMCDLATMLEVNGL